jgi:hypothetical protein
MLLPNTAKIELGKLSRKKHPLDAEEQEEKRETH